MFFCCYGSAENKYLKVPPIRDDIVVEFKVQLALRYGECVRVLLCPLSSSQQNHTELFESSDLMRGNQLESFILFKDT